MSTFAIIFWTVVITVAVVLFLIKLGEKSTDEGTGSEWERYERQRMMLDANLRALERDADQQRQDQQRMKIVGARMVKSEVLVTVEDGTEHPINVGPDFPFLPQEFVGRSLKEAQDAYPD